MKHNSNKNTKNRLNSDSTTSSVMELHRAEERVEYVVELDAHAWKQGLKHNFSTRPSLLTTSHCKNCQHKQLSLTPMSIQYHCPTLH